MSPKPRNEWNGPDGIDIAGMIRAMQQLHEGSTISIKLTSDGALYSGSMHVVVKAVAPELVGPGRTYTEQLATVWPNNQSRTLEGCIFKLLHEMDAKLSRELWHQETFA